MPKDSCSLALHRARGLGISASLCLLCLGLVACDRTQEMASSAYARGDYTTAFTSYQKLAKDGNADAQFTLGLMYFEGAGTEKDFTEAARWYRRAANQGQMMAQNNLGAVLMDGKGVPRDYAEAAFWFALVAKAGDSHGKQLRDVAAAHLTGEEQDAVRKKVEAWKPIKESKSWFD